MKLTTIASIISVFFIIGCNDQESKIHNQESWEGLGTIQLGFETSSFHPNSLDEYWWVSFDSDSAYNAYINYAGPAKPVVDYNDRISFYKKVTCKIKGQLSKPGNYGHMGIYDRKIKIKEIVKILD